MKIHFRSYIYVINDHYELYWYTCIILVSDHDNHLIYVKVYKSTTGESHGSYYILPYLSVRLPYTSYKVRNLLTFAHSRFVKFVENEAAGQPPPPPPYTFYKTSIGPQ